MDVSFSKGEERQEAGGREAPASGSSTSSTSHHGRCCLPGFRADTTNAMLFQAKTAIQIRAKKS